MIAFVGPSGSGKSTVLRILFNSMNMFKLIEQLCCVKSHFMHYLGPEQVDRAFNLGLAAVLGEGVYNFGELVSTNILIFTTISSS